MAESSKMDRQGARTPAQLQEQYNFGTKFAEAFGLITAASLEAAKASQAVKNLDENLTPEEIFDRLTDGGKAQGLYRDENGNIFINASYIAAGILASQNGATKFNLNTGALSTEDTYSKWKLELDTAKIRLLDKERKVFDIYNLGYGGAVNFWNPDTGKLVGYLIGFLEGLFISCDEISCNTINPGKKVLYTGNVAAGSTFDVPNTANYDLFAVKLGTSSTTENTVVMAYKVGDTIRGVGGWSGDATQNIKLFFLSATFDGDRWTVIDATSKELAGTSVGSAVKLNVKEVVGVI